MHENAEQYIRCKWVKPVKNSKIRVSQFWSSSELIFHTFTIQIWDIYIYVIHFGQLFLQCQETEHICRGCSQHILRLSDRVYISNWKFLKVFSKGVLFTM